MGVSCEIHLRKPPDGFYKPGSFVSGAVKYTVHEDTYFEDIVACLRGKGRCRWTEGNGDWNSTYCNREDYVNIFISLLDKNTDHEEVSVEAGTYTRQFQFIFPPDIPSSYKDFNCTISYYVKIKFVKKGLFNFNKSFRTEISFKNSPIISELPSEPITYGVQKSLVALSNLFSSDQNVLRMKAVIAKSVLMPGDVAELQIEVQNDSTARVSTVETQLMKKITHISHNGRKHRRTHDVETAKSATDAVEEKCSANFLSTIRIPDTDYAIQYSKILELDYVVLIKARLPFPHLNLKLEVPLVIGELVGGVGDARECLQEPAALPDDPPPSYWQVMREDKIIEGKIKINN